MTSMFDQYNLTLKRNDIHDPTPIQNSVPQSSGYVSVRMKEEPPIFSKQKMKLNLPHDILHLIVRNNWLVTLMSHQVLLRLFLLQPDRQDEVFLEKYLNELRVTKLFLDPLGNHLLISLSNGHASELLYLHRKTNKPKRIEKFKDHEITAVAFNFNNQSETNTGSILLGTNKGLIFETEFGVEGDKKLQNNWKQVFDIGKGENCPITGIEFYKVPNTMRYIVFVATQDRLYTFHEVLKVDEKFPYLQHIFNSYLNVPEHLKDFFEIPSKLKLPKLKFIYESINNKYPKRFGFLTDTEIFSGEIDAKAESPQFVSTTELIPFTVTTESTGETPIPSKTTPTITTNYTPISFELTDFHAILLFSDHVKAISLLNFQTVYEEYFIEPNVKMIDIIKDTQTDTIYLYSSRSIFRYKITSEHRNVWRMYLDKMDFDMARKYSRDNPAHLDIVLVKQAELYFQNKDYQRSAIAFSETQSSFEAVCLRFLEIDQKEALMIFLRNRLDALVQNDETQITMLVVWLVELYLMEMARYVENQSKVRQLQKDFQNFMNSTRVVECVKTNRTVIYDLMASHGDTFNLTSLTTINKDYESVINQYINQNNYVDALSILQGQNKPDLYYKYCPILMAEIPKETIAAIMTQGKRLNSVKLIPTLICLDDDVHVNEIIKYLEYCVHSAGCTEQAIHNFIVKIYAQYRPEKLLIYLEMQGKDISLIQYDVHYALRVCNEHQAKKASVFLQCLLELWHAAVELALTFDAKLAQQTASQPIDRDLRRKLWLRIAEHEITGKDDVKQALELLKECDLLRIEDLLPFFSDFEKIDHFKEAICDALKEYNIRIQDQRRDMEDAAKSAERVRSELQTFRNRSLVIGSQEMCTVCNVYLLLKPFFIFPCGHKFHAECLEKNLTVYLNMEQNRKLVNLKQQLQSANIQCSDDGNVNGTMVKSREQLKLDYENMIAAECIFCGEHMINSIDQPFINDWNKVNNDWL